MEQEVKTKKKKRLLVIILIVVLAVIITFSSYLIYMFWPIWRAERMVKELHHATAYNGSIYRLYNEHQDEMDKYYCYYDAMRHFPSKYSKKELKEKFTDKRSKAQYDFFIKQYKNFEYQSDYSSICFYQFKWPWDAKKAMEESQFYLGERYYYDQHDFIDDKEKFRVGYAWTGITGASYFYIEGFAIQGNCYVVYSTMIEGESVDPKYKEMIQKECEMLDLPDPFEIMEKY
jgi:hypothetical protein